MLHLVFNTLLWRAGWEFTNDPKLKEKLVIYNAEDCEATEKVAWQTDTLSRIAVVESGIFQRWQSFQDTRTMEPFAFEASIRVVPYST